MGAQFSKGGVAVEGKAAADPANAKANGQVSDLGLTCPASAGSHMAPNAHWQAWVTRLGFQPKYCFF